LQKKEEFKRNLEEKIKVENFNFDFSTKF